MTAGDLAIPRGRYGQGDFLDVLMDRDEQNLFDVAVEELVRKNSGSSLQVVSLLPCPGWPFLPMLTREVV